MQTIPIRLFAVQSADTAARWDRAAILVGLLVAVVLVRELVVLIVRGRRAHADREQASQPPARDRDEP